MALLNASILKTVECYSFAAAACPVKHIAEADHPTAGPLIIAANLTATGKARIVVTD